MACTKYDDADQAALVKAYLNYIISADGQEAAARTPARRRSATRCGRKIQPAVDAIGGPDHRATHCRTAWGASRTSPGRRSPCHTATEGDSRDRRRSDPSSAAPTDRRRGVRRPVFSGTATGAGVLILATLAGVALFLIVKAWPAITADATRDLPGGEGLAQLHLAARLRHARGGRDRDRDRRPARGRGRAVHQPLSRRAGSPSRSATSIDLLAAIPSVIYGLWGIAVLGPASVGLQQWLEDNLGFIPFFKGPASATGRTMLVAGLVLAVMILPIITAVTREVFAQTPRRCRGGRARARRDALGDDPA